MKLNARITHILNEADYMKVGQNFVVVVKGKEEGVAGYVAMASGCDVEYSGWCGGTG